MSSKIHIFTHHDLDGIGCLLTLLWSFAEQPGVDVTYTTVTNASKIREAYTKWSSENNIKDFSKVFITDLSIPIDDIEVIDNEKVIFIDHHKSSLAFKFKYATHFIKVTTSCTLYLYKNIFTQLQQNLTQKQKELLVLIDDYDSYTLQFSNSKKLNTLFYNFYFNRINNFLEDYNDGFYPFTDIQNNVINIHSLKLEKAIKELQLFYATIPIQNQSCKCISVFADSAINDIAEYILMTYQADIAIVVNIKNERVSFRRGKKCNIDVSLLVQKLCKGGGHEAAGGGSITENFLSFSKLFTPLNDTTTISK